MDNYEAIAWEQELTEILELEKEEMRKTFAPQPMTPGGGGGDLQLPGWLQ